MPENLKKAIILQGVTRLVTDATLGVAGIVESMHKRIVHPPFLPSTRAQGLITTVAGSTYYNIRKGTELVSTELNRMLGLLSPVLGKIKPSEQKEAFQSALNGVIGDYLEAQSNPLQITMQFRHQSRRIPMDPKGIQNTYSDINGNILLMIHGSSLNDRKWTRKEHNHGLALAEELGKTPVFLFYNSGRHISSNGRSLHEELEKLVSNWPVPVEELTLVAHSMGGLVARSAIHYGKEVSSTWTRYLKKVVFLGTPHHGAPLERFGNYLDTILKTIPYAKPFARLSRVRSAGVTDLRYGNLIDEDWEGQDRFALQGDHRTTIPLPDRVECYSVAAVVAKQKATKKTYLSGDRLVTVKSALGMHKNPSKDLHFKKENTWISYETTHSDLLSSRDVYAKIKGWVEDKS